MNSYEGGLEGKAPFLKKDLYTEMHTCKDAAHLAFFDLSQGDPSESQQRSCKRSTLPQNGFLHFGWPKLSFQDLPLLQRQTSLTVG